MGVPNVALAELANLWGDVSSPVAMTFMAVGEGATAFAAADTELDSEITGSGLTRTDSSVAVTRTTTSTTDDTTQLVKTFTITGTETIKEVGIFTAAANGAIMGGRTVLTTPKDVVDGSSYTLTHKTIFARS